MSKGQKKKPTFEESLERLSEIVEELEAGELSLDDSLARFEEGRQVVNGCYGLLQEAESRIEQMIEADDGKPQTAPFEPGAAQTGKAGG